jgi:hypothetical protein
MDTHSFDRVARLLARRRLSRRAAIAAGGAALGMTAVGAAGEAAPGAPETAADTVFLFVQSFAAGLLVPDEARPGAFTLTLADGLGHTLYFSDRPRRIVGALPTATFLDRLGFGPDNPPNAALLAHQDETHEDVVILELLNPRYDQATHTATYDVKLLQDLHRVDMTFGQTPATEVDSARKYGASHLFIDDYDCADACVACLTQASWPNPVGMFGPMPFCPVLDGSEVCAPCPSDGSTPVRLDENYWLGRCNAEVPGCNGACNYAGASGYCSPDAIPAHAP